MCLFPRCDARRQAARGPATLRQAALSAIRHNEALVRRPTIVNDDCYGWMLLLRPADGVDWRASLVTGAAIAPAYECWMEGEAFPGCSPDGLATL